MLLVLLNSADETKLFFILIKVFLLVSDWHSCLMCHKNAKFHCFCCPNAFCGSCISSADFGAVKGNGGFCEDCLELILLGEENEAYDSNGVCVTIFQVL